jgi:hypothetical protein
MLPNANIAGGGLRPLRLAPLRGLVMEQQKKCSGEHDIYVPEVFYVQQEGKVVVVTVCRACDTVNFHQHQIADPHHSAEALKTVKEK